MSRLGLLMRAALAAAALLHGVSLGHAAGALAIGQCAAYGFSYDHPTLTRAKKAALQQCAGPCEQLVTTQKGCAAFAIDGHKPCGPLGYASARRLGEAQNTALRQCHQHGGKDCVVRAWICDGRG